MNIFGKKKPKRMPQPKTDDKDKTGNPVKDAKKTVKDYVKRRQDIMDQL